MTFLLVLNKELGLHNHHALRLFQRLEFQAIPFVSSGAISKINNESKSIALACGSHSGSKLHSREAFKILWEYDIDINNLKCPKTKTSPLEHNCSGKHAAFLATCKKMNWPLDSYLKGDHPLQIEIFRIVSELLETVLVLTL